MSGNFSIGHGNWSPDIESVDEIYNALSAPIEGCPNNCEGWRKEGGQFCEDCLAEPEGE